MFYRALQDGGYVESLNPAQADFIVHDAVHPNLEPFLITKPNFITPHAPQSSFMWDGMLGTGFPVCCNFVTGEAGKKVMAAYHYPYRVEVVGFNRCEVREFTPATGNDLLIIPSHAIQNGQYTYSDYIGWVVLMLRFILRHRSYFGKITLCWNETRFDPALMDEMIKQGFDIIPTNPYKDPDPLLHMMERMDQADLVMSCGTAGCVSVAMGRPTVFCTELGQPRSFPRDALHPELYHHYLLFPLAAEKMTIEEILAVRTSQNSKVEYWKQQVIGGPFDPQKFISVVKQYVDERHG